MRCLAPQTLQRGGLAGLPGTLQRPCGRFPACSATADRRSAAAGVCGLAAALAVLPTAPADALILEPAAPQQERRAAAAQPPPLLLLADGAPPVAEATPEDRAAFARAQETTGVKWGAYLVAWSAWLAWDVYRQQQRKDAEGGGGDASSGGGGGEAAAEEAKQQ